ncbi:uncharacterized protein zgc:113425 [Thalassophryne amazonica]|uniref:uncharacterized protein zgc:113425 n=1 Tax=Thalassophryne amazonica TaxID=390379 RepID=UPI0014716011|nr:uncharacterized protein zgc:113425 [Thalassophryne amazonica]
MAWQMSEAETVARSKTNIVLIMACAGFLALFASQKKNSVLVSSMVVTAALSCVAALCVSAYSSLTLTYGEDNQEVFHHHDSPQVTFVLHRVVKGSNATILLSCVISLVLSLLIVHIGCRSLPCCACYDSTTGLEMLLPQSEPADAELVCQWTGGDTRLFNAPVQLTDQGTTEEAAEGPSNLPPYSRLT